MLSRTDDVACDRSRHRRVTALRNAGLGGHFVPVAAPDSWSVRAQHLGRSVATTRSPSLNPGMPLGAPRGSSPQYVKFTVAEVVEHCPPRRGSGVVGATCHEVPHVARGGPSSRERPEGHCCIKPSRSGSTGRFLCSAKPVTLLAWCKPPVAGPGRRGAGLQPYESKILRRRLEAIA